MKRQLDKIYIVRQYKEDTEPTYYEIRGIFTGKSMAIKACTDENHCYQIMEIDKDYGYLPVELASYWPKMQTTEDE